MTVRMPRAPGAVRWITRTLEEAGHDTWVVGGAIRDALMGVAHDDWDLATRARPREVRRLFRRTVPIGVDHGTVGVLARDGTLYEVTTFRRDVETFGRRAVVEFADRVEDDLARRDFTMNAAAWHPLREEVLDPFDGLKDLERGVLRTVGQASERFAEDFLRVLRGLRFAGRYRLSVEADTWLALCGATAHLDHLSAERVRDELLKVLTLDPAPSGALSLYAASGALAQAFPELQDRLQAEADGGGAVWSEALLAADLLPASRPLVRLAALLAGVEPDRVAAFLLRLRFSNAQVSGLGDLVAALGRPAPGGSAPEARRWLAAAGPDVLNDWTRVRGARARVRAVRGPGEGDPYADGPRHVAADWRRLRTQVRSGAPLAVTDLALSGRDLIHMGMRPGPHFGRILDALLDRVLQDPGLNRREALEPLARELAAAASTPGDGGA